LVQFRHIAGFALGEGIMTHRIEASPVGELGRS